MSRDQVPIIAVAGLVGATILTRSNVFELLMRFVRLCGVVALNIADVPFSDEQLVELRGVMSRFCRNTT